MAHQNSRTNVSGSAQQSPPLSDSRLIEDTHQGSTSASALKSFDQYRRFVARKEAPVAQMKYSPFTKTETPIRQQYTDSTFDTSVPASSTNPTTPTSTFSASSGSSYSNHAAHNHLHSFPTSAASSRATSPVHGAHLLSHERTHTSLAPTPQLEPSVLHVKEGSAAWTLDLPDWNKHNGSSSTQTSPKGEFAKRRGSLTSRSGTGGGLSRKNSDTNLDKMANVLNTGSRRSSWRDQRHEQSNQILAAVHVPHATHRTTLSQEKQFSSGESTLLKDTTQSKNEKRHTNAPYPYLHAHAHDGSRLAAGGKKDLRDSRTKRFSTMPTIEGSKTRGTNLLSDPISKSNNPIARRGSVSHVPSGNATNASNAAAWSDRRQTNFRHRSQSLPCDSLFLAYSNCALPAVMAGALANMPIPAQPAIPVSVARRYSILSHQDEHSQLATHDTSQPNTPTSRSMSESFNSVASSGGYDGLGNRSYEEDEVVNVDPEDVVGIDTSSTLDVSHIRDAPYSLAEGDEDAEELSDEKEAETEENESKEPFQPSAGEGTSAAVADLEVLPQTFRANRRMSIDKHKAASVQSTPVVSPVEPTNGHTAPVAATHGGNSMGGSVSSPATAERLPFGGHKAAFPTFARDDLYESSPDFTPVTSPTNLSHASFKQTLLTRRMSELVAKDIQKKLRILKKHMQHDDSVASNPNHANQ